MKAQNIVVVAVFLLLCGALGWGCSTGSEAPGTETEVPVAGGDPYQLEVKAPATAKVGQEATTEVIVTPRNGFKINLEYPAKLVIKSVPEGAKVPVTTLRKGQMSMEKTRLSAPVRFTVDAPGEKTFEGEFRFGVCNDQGCQMPREKIRWTTVAEAAAQ